MQFGISIYILESSVNRKLANYRRYWGQPQPSCEDKDSRRCGKLGEWAWNLCRRHKYAKKIDNIIELRLNNLKWIQFYRFNFYGKTN